MRDHRQALDELWSCQILHTVCCCGSLEGVIQVQDARMQSGAARSAPQTYVSLRLCCEACAADKQKAFYDSNCHQITHAWFIACPAWYRTPKCQCHIIYKTWVEVAIWHACKDAAMVNSKTRSVCHKLPYRVLQIQDPKDAPCRRACQIAWITNIWIRMTGRPMIHWYACQMYLLHKHGCTVRTAVNICWLLTRQIFACRP